jgi:glycosyltransferase involved in cell wall biosynthesis
MRASVVIRSKDEADRLRLVLASLSCQTEQAEILVVNDGSTDHTPEVIDEIAPQLDLIAIHHGSPAGRAEASNRGAERASGDILIFLDGDTVAAPDLVERHLQLYRHRGDLTVRGDTWHIRSTRMFLDPERGTPRPGEEIKVARMSEAERARSLVTRRQIREDFASIDRRAQPAIYPGYGPRRLYELEMRALSETPDCEVLWAAAAGANQSVPRAAFIAAGGFNAALTINEHRELALRLCRNGLSMVPCSGRSYHLTHRNGWRDPLAITDWEDIFYAAHPTSAVALLPLFWESLGDKPDLPEHARLHGLEELAEAARQHRDVTGRDAIRQAYLAAAGQKVADRG